MSALSHLSEASPEVRLACTQLRGRLKAGESLRVEDLLAAYPTLSLSDEAVFELIHAEVSTRRELGDRPTLEEWQTRFPALLRRREDLDTLRSLFGSEMPTLSDGASPHQANELGPARGADGRLPKLGQYQLIQEIGRGGMGVVYKARQSSLSRVVALKMILAGAHAGLRERARLRNEAEAAAQLLHPNVVQIFEIGEHEGLPFLTMEFVAGGNLRRMLRATPQAFRWSARMTETLARAIHVAHDRGIVHRDLNPSNILMTTDGTPKITDFGLAKFLLDDAGVSLNGVILGTPSYMAPEQVSGHRRGIGPGADIYALGALLYEMLTGTAPFRGLTPMETLCQVVEAEIVPPSRLRHGVPEDLETICLKCLEKEPSRRYATASELADDLRRFQENQPVQARRTSLVRQVMHWSRRQRLAASLLGLSVLLLVALLSLVGGYLITMSRVNHKLKRDLAEIQMLRGLGDISKGQIETGVKFKDLRHRYDSKLNQIKQCVEIGQVELAQQLFSELGTEQSPGFEWFYLDRLLHGAARSLGGHTSPVTSLAVASRGGLMASGDDSGNVFAWDFSNREPRPCQGRHDAPVQKVAVAVASRGGVDTIASLSQRADGSLDLKLWNATTGAAIQSIRTEPFKITEIAFSPDATRLTLEGHSPSGPQPICMSWRSGPSGWEPEPATKPGGEAVQAVSADGKRRALGKMDGTVELYEAAHPGAVELAQKPGARVLCLAFCSDGTRLAAGREDGSVTVWDTGNRRILVHEAGRGVPLVFVAFAQGPGRLVGWDQGDGLWFEDLEQPGSRRLLPGSDSRIDSIKLAENATVLAAVMLNQTVKVWDLSAGDVLGTYLATEKVRDVGFAPDGQSLLIGCQDGQIRAWRFRESKDLPQTLAGHVASVRSLAFSPDDQLLASSSDDHTIKIWDTQTGRELLGLARHDRAVTGLVFLSDGRLISTGLDGRIVIWDVKRASPGEGLVLARETELHHGEEPLLSLSVPNTENIHLLAVGDSKGVIQIWDLVANRVRFKLNGHQGTVHSVAYACNPSVLASASEDRTVRFWDGKSDAPRDTQRFDQAMRTVAFSADGMKMAASGDTREVAIWSTLNMTIQQTLSAHPLTVRSVAFSADGQIIATACDDGRIRLWDTDTGLQLYSLLGHRDRINALTFSHDGTILASSDQSGRIKLWRSSRPSGGKAAFAQLP
jgi:WD40 repeat protein/serine/threonine protein kinase